jgi:DNA-binding Xre family transcriptional regulator
MKPTKDYSAMLRSHMQRVNIASYRALAAQAQVSRWQVQQLRVGNVKQMRLAVIIQLADVLKLSVGELLSELGWEEFAAKPLEKPLDSSEQPSSAELAALRQAYQQLQTQVAQQVAQVRSQVQTEALQTLETWLVQWPTIAKRAPEKLELSAAKILPFVRPVEQLMVEWGVEAIAPVDAEVPYDPQLHQLDQGAAQVGDPVRVTHSGSQYQGKLLHRAKVKPLG